MTDAPRTSRRLIPWALPALVAVIAIGAYLAGAFRADADCAFDATTGRLDVTLPDDLAVAVDHSSADDVVYLVVEGEPIACTDGAVASGVVTEIVFDGDLDPSRTWIDNLSGATFRTADGGTSGTVDGDGLLSNALGS